MKVWPFILGFICGSIILTIISTTAIKKEKDRTNWELKANKRIEVVQLKHDNVVRQISDPTALQDELIKINEMVMDLTVKMGSLYPEMRKEIMTTLNEVEEKYDRGEYN